MAQPVGPPWEVRIIGSYPCDLNVNFGNHQIMRDNVRGPQTSQNSTLMNPKFVWLSHESETIVGLFLGNSSWSMSFDDCP